MKKLDRGHVPGVSRPRFFVMGVGQREALTLSTLEVFAGMCGKPRGTPKAVKDRRWRRLRRLNHGVFRLPTQMVKMFITEGGHR